MPFLNKKNITRLFITIASICLLGGVWWGIQNYPFSLSGEDALSAVPRNSAVVIEINNPIQLLKEITDKPYLEEVNQLNFVEKIKEQFKTIVEKFKLESTVIDAKLTIAAQIGEKNELDFIYIFNKLPQKDFILKDYLAAGLPSMQERIFNEHPFYILPLTDTSALSIAQVGDLIVVAGSSFLIESVLDQVDNFTESITTETAFKKIHSLLGKKKPFKIFINMKLVPVFASFFTATKPQKDIEFLKFFAEWVGLEVSFQDQIISIDGYLFPSENNQLLKSLKKQKLPDKTLIASILPDNTAAMTYIGFKSAPVFFNQISLTNNNDFQEYFIPWMGSELAYLVTEPPMSNHSGFQFAIFQTQNSDLAAQKLEAFGAQFGTLATEQHFNYNIQQLLAKDILKPVFGNGLNPIHNPFYVVLEDYVVFCNSLEGLKGLLDKYTYGQTLGKDINYLKFVESLSSTSNMYVYMNTSNVLNLLKHIFKEEYAPSIKKEFAYYQKLTPIGLQFTPYQDVFVLNGQMKYNAKGKQATSVLWKTDLESEAAIAPVLVKNHQTGEQEIFVQDVENRVYLLNRDGEILWDKQLEERIISDVVQVDYYKNTYLQYVFNTQNKIYLMDRNGEDVEHFPIQLEEGLTNGMLVVDYDGTRDYRYFVATEAGNVFGMAQDGEPLEGWSPKSNMGIIQYPLQHFVRNEEDFLVALNEAGEIFFFKRNGEVRMDSLQFKEKNLSPFGYDLSKPERVVMANSEGKVYVLNLNRRFFKLNMKLEDNKEMQFEFIDVWGNKRKDYVAMSKRKLGVFSYNEKNLFEKMSEYTFKEKQSQLFKVKMPENPKHNIGTLSKEAKKVYLFNGEGELFPDFPIAGTTPFKVTDLFDNGMNVLIVADKNAVFAYKLKNLTF